MQYFFFFWKAFCIFCTSPMQDATAAIVKEKHMETVEKEAEWQEEEDI